MQNSFLKPQCFSAWLGNEFYVCLNNPKTRLIQPTNQGSHFCPEIPSSTTSQVEWPTSIQRSTLPNDFHGEKYVPKLRECHPCDHEEVQRYRTKPTLCLKGKRWQKAITGKLEIDVGFCTKLHSRIPQKSVFQKQVDVIAICAIYSHVSRDLSRRNGCILGQVLHPPGKLQPIVQWWLLGGLLS